jgi:hypothetical protein
MQARIVDLHVEPAPDWLGINNEPPLLGTGSQNMVKLKYSTVKAGLSKM